MTRLSNLTYRNLLIAVHDALATTFAVLASFYLRFEGGQSFLDRLPLLLRILPHFVAGCAEYSARGYGADRCAAGSRLHFRGAECLWRFLSRQGHYRSLLVS